MQIAKTEQINGLGKTYRTITATFSHPIIARVVARTLGNGAITVNGAFMIDGNLRATVKDAVIAFDNQCKVGLFDETVQRLAEIAQQVEAQMDSPLISELCAQIEDLNRRIEEMRAAHRIHYERLTRLEAINAHERLNRLNEEMNELRGRVDATEVTIAMRPSPLARLRRRLSHSIARFLRKGRAYDIE